LAGGDDLQAMNGKRRLGVGLSAFAISTSTLRGGAAARRVAFTRTVSKAMGLAAEQRHR